MPDQTVLPNLTVRAVWARPIEVPLNFVLGTSQGALAAEADTLLAMGNFTAVKLRLGYPTFAENIAAVRAVRLAIVDGHAVTPERPGNGMVWDEDAVERYRPR
jgi:L-alanine-DL-glutamate epimerase-like enolase superfamily enzyme